MAPPPRGLDAMRYGEGPRSPLLGDRADRSSYLRIEHPADKVRLNCADLPNGARCVAGLEVTVPVHIDDWGRSGGAEVLRRVPGIQNQVVLLEVARESPPDHYGRIALWHLTNYY